MDTSWRNTIELALQEDIRTGDITSEATIPQDTVLTGIFVAKEPGVVAGLEVVEEVFRLVDKTIIFTPKILDGHLIQKGATVATVRGSGRSILAAERVSLNFLQRMSGIATQTRRFVEAVKGTPATILDTRKTAPGLRFFDKWAVRIGGGQNHRFGLFDMVLVKDNHIAACGSITRAIQSVRKKTRLPIEVEVKSLRELKEALALRPDRIMLDNMNTQEMQKAVEITRDLVPLEASGRVTLKNVRSIAQTGVTYISVGSLTHSVKALDISLEIDTSFLS